MILNQTSLCLSRSAPIKVFIHLLPSLDCGMFFTKPLSHLPAILGPNSILDLRSGELRKVWAGPSNWKCENCSLMEARWPRPRSLRHTYTQTQWNANPEGKRRTSCFPLSQSPSLRRASTGTEKDHHVQAQMDRSGRLWARHLGSDEEPSENKQLIMWSWWRTITHQQKHSQQIGSEAEIAVFRRNRQNCSLRHSTHCRRWIDVQRLNFSKNKSPHEFSTCSRACSQKGSLR